MEKGIAGSVDRARENWKQDWASYNKKRDDFYGQYHKNPMLWVLDPAATKAHRAYKDTKKPADSFTHSWVLEGSDRDVSPMRQEARDFSANLRGKQPDPVLGAYAAPAMARQQAGAPAPFDLKAKQKAGAPDYALAQSWARGDDVHTGHLPMHGQPVKTGPSKLSSEAYILPWQSKPFMESTGPRGSNVRTGEPWRGGASIPSGIPPALERPGQQGPAAQGAAPSGGNFLDQGFDDFMQSLIGEWGGF